MITALHCTDDHTALHRWSLHCTARTIIVHCTHDHCTALHTVDHKVDQCTALHRWSGASLEFAHANGIKRWGGHFSSKARLETKHLAMHAVNNTNKFIIVKQNNNHSMARPGAAGISTPRPGLWWHKHCAANNFKSRWIRFCLGTSFEITWWHTHKM